MAVSIYEEFSIWGCWISDFFDGDSDQLDPCFAAFKRVDQICDDGNKFNKITDNLELDKASLRIDLLTMDENNSNDIRELYKDKKPNLMIENLHLKYNFKSKRWTEDIEFINQISPKMLTIERGGWTVENIKDLTLLNCANVDLNFYFMIKINIYLLFINTPIQLFDSKSDQIFTFQWESIKIFLERHENKFIYKTKKTGIEEVKLLKTNTGNFLFIPLDSISSLSISRFREILSVDDINKQFADLRVQHQFKENGLIIPMGYSNRIFIDLNDDLDYLNEYKDINTIFKENHIEITIKSLGRLLEIKKLLPDNFSRIHFKYSSSYDLTDIGKYSMSEIKNGLDWINLKFKEIYQFSKLSPDEFQFWWKVLRSRRTRFNLTEINLKFRLLSECLTVLSLCSDCPELESIKLEYSKADAENEDETVKQAKREFRQKFGFIQKLIIRENDE